MSIPKKPEYTYTYKAGQVFIGSSAILILGDDHPEFAGKLVRTSAVVAFDSEGVIETANSIYKKALAP